MDFVTSFISPKKHFTLFLIKSLKKKAVDMESVNRQMKDIDVVMRILTVADVVVPSLYREFDREKFKNIDLVLACGDLPPEYLSFLLHVFEVPVYYVMGNHDIRHSKKPPMGCMDIHGRMVHHNGIKIMGLGGSRWYNGGPNQYREKEMKAVIRKLRLTLWWNKGVDILITHAPPRHIHDAEDRCHRGFQCYVSFINKYSPSYLIHGHIHKMFDYPEQRITTVNNTRVVNAYGYHIIKINAEKDSG